MGSIYVIKYRFLVEKYENLIFSKINLVIRLVGYILIISENIELLRILRNT